MPARMVGLLVWLLFSGTTPAAGLRDPLLEAVYVADEDFLDQVLGRIDEGVHVSGQAPAVVDHRDEHGRTQLMVCGFDGRLQRGALDATCGRIAKTLIDAGADPRAKDLKGWSVVAYAASYGWASMVRVLVEAGADIHEPDDKGMTPITKASLHGRHAAVSALLDAGAKVSHRTAQNQGWTALHYAARNAHNIPTREWLRTIRVIVSSGNVDVNEPADDGTTALHVAASVGAVEAVELLLSSGARPDVKRGDGATPLALTPSEGVKGLLREALIEQANRSHKEWNREARQQGHRKAEAASSMRGGADEPGQGPVNREAAAGVSKSGEGRQDTAGKPKSRSSSAGAGVSSSAAISVTIGQATSTASKSAGRRERDATKAGAEGRGKGSSSSSSEL